MVSFKQIHAFTLHLAIFYAPRTEFSVSNFKLLIV